MTISKYKAALSLGLNTVCTIVPMEKLFSKLMRIIKKEFSFLIKFQVFVKIK